MIVQHLPSTIRALRGPSIAIAVAAVLWLAASVHATVAPPVKIRLLDPRPAEAGAAYHGVLEITSAVTGVLAGLELGGKGWAVVNFAAPPWIELVARERITLPFVATASTPIRPLVVEAELDGRAVSARFDVSAEHFEWVERPATLVSAVGDWEGRFPGADYSRPSPETAPRSEREIEFLDRVREADGGGAGSRDIRVYGRIVYRRRDGVEIGVDTATIRIKDSDPLYPDETMRTAKTDPYGYFDVTFTWDSSFFRSIPFRDPNVFLEIEAQNGAVTVQSGTLELCYSWETSTRDGFGGSEIDYGVLGPADLDPSNRQAAFHILNTMTRAKRWLLENENYRPRRVDVQWPDGDSAFYRRSFDEIHISTAEQWNEWTALHEYGHYFLDTFGAYDSHDYCNDVCDEPECTHCVWCEEDGHIAWSEGWADWFGSVVVRSLSSYGEVPLDIQTHENIMRCTEPADQTYHNAWRTEGLFAALLRDIEDSSNESSSAVATRPDAEDALSLGTHEIFEVTVRDKPKKARAFIEKFLARYPEYHEQFDRTAALNGFDLADYPPSLVVAESFDDIFSGGEGIPNSWTNRSGLWVNRGGELSVNTGSRAGFRGLSVAPAVVGDEEGKVDFFMLDFERELIHFSGSDELGWAARNVTADLPGDAAPYRIWDRPIVMRRASGAFDIISTSVDRYSLGSRNVIHYTYSDAAGWVAENLNAFPGVGTTKRVLGPLAAVSDAHSIDIFGLGLRGELLRFSLEEGGSWTSEDITSGLAGAPLFLTNPTPQQPLEVHRSSSGSIHVVGIGRSNFGAPLGLAHYRYEPSTRWVLPPSGNPQGQVLVQAGWIGYMASHSIDLDELSLELDFRHALESVLRNDGDLDVITVTTSATDRQLVRLHASYFSNWTAENVSELAWEFRGVNVPVVVSRGGGSLDVIATTVANLGRRDLLHFSWTGGGWSAHSLFESPNSYYSTIGTPFVSSPSAENLEVFTALGSQVSPYELWNFRWSDSGDWEFEAVSNRLKEGGEPPELYLLGHTEVSAYADAEGNRHAFATRYGSIDASTESNLLHFSRRSGEDWSSEDLHGGLGGRQPFLVVGDPELVFEDTRSVSFRMRFLHRPEAPGRQAGVFVCAQGPNDRSTGNSGYYVYWLDGPLARGYNVVAVTRGEFDNGVISDAIEPGEHWNVVIDDFAVRLIVDGDEKARLDDDRFRSGHVGLWVGPNGQDVRFDDVTVRTRVDPMATPLRINMGGTRTVDSRGRVWLADWSVGNNDPLGIRPLSDGGALAAQDWEAVNLQPASLNSLGFDGSSAADRSIMNSIRFDYGGDDTPFRIELPVANGLYAADLLLTENYWESPDARRFRVEIQGVLVDDDISVRDYSPDNPVQGWAGRLSYDTIAVDDGLLRIALLPCGPALCPGSVDTNAMVSAIEVGEMERVDPPEKPTGLTGVVDGSRIELDWNDSTADQLLGYRVQRAVLPSGQFSVVPGGLLANSNFVDEPVVFGGEYRYRVVAVNPAGESAVSDAISLGVPAVDHFADCFDRGPGPAEGWVVLQGAWGISENETLMTTTADGKSWVWADKPIAASTTTTVFEFDVSRVEFTGAPGNGIKRHFGMMFFSNRTTSNRFASDSNGYAVYWIDRQSDFGLTLGRWDGATLVPLHQGTGAQLADPPAVWRVEVTGSTIRFVGDGVTHIEIEDSTYRGGFTGFWAWSRMDVEIGGVRIGAPNDLESCSSAGIRTPADCNEDGRFDISDPICLLLHLFFGEPALLPCGDGSRSDLGNRALLDHNGDESIDLSDAVGMLQSLFVQGAPPPPLGMRCVPVDGCVGDVCADGS